MTVTDDEIKAAAVIESLTVERNKLAELVNELAQTDPIIDDDYCSFCLKLVDYPHDETCLWKRAKALNEQSIVTKQEA